MGAYELPGDEPLDVATGGGGNYNTSAIIHLRGWIELEGPPEMSSDFDTTQTLMAATEGGREAAARLMPVVYDELRALAAKLMAAERRDHTLHPTAVVHEAYLRMIDQKRADWKCSSHFRAICANMMRRVLVDHARRRGAAKRGGGVGRVNLDDERDGAKSAAGDVDILTLHTALEELEELNRRQARVVELCYYGGLSVKETAEELSVSERTVKDDWRIAKAWLGVRLRR